MPWYGPISGRRKISRSGRRCCCRFSVGDVLCVFFFQAEDGIRDTSVTGVQTCALPISTVSKDVILAQIRTAVGQPYSDSTVEDDIRSLYKTGTIQNVRIFAQPEEDGVKVIVAVQTRQVLRELVIDGAQRVSAKKLRKEIGVKLNSPVNEDDLQKARQKIIERYQSKGFTDITVDFRVEPIDESRGTARVIYTVNEGVRGAVKRIRFEGNEHFSEKILRKQMKTRGKTMVSFIDKSGRLDEVQLQQDL